MWAKAKINDTRKKATRKKRVITTVEVYFSADMLIKTRKNLYTHTHARSNIPKEKVIFWPYNTCNSSNSCIQCKEGILGVIVRFTMMRAFDMTRQSRLMEND